MGHFCLQGDGGKATSLSDNYLVSLRVCAPYSPHLQQFVLRKFAEAVMPLALTQVASEPTIWHMRVRATRKKLSRLCAFLVRQRKSPIKGLGTQSCLTQYTHTRPSKPSMRFLVRQRKSSIKGLGARTAAREDVTFLHSAPHYLYRSGVWGHAP